MNVIIGLKFQAVTAWTLVDTGRDRIGCRFSLFPDSQANDLLAGLCWRRDDGGYRATDRGDAPQAKKAELQHTGTSLAKTSQEGTRMQEIVATQTTMLL
jgi:hypothetical protein